MVTGAVVNTLLLLAFITAVLAAAAYALLLGVRAIVWLLVPVYRPIVRRRRAREAARRERSIAAIRAARESVKREWARRKAHRT